MANLISSVLTVALVLEFKFVLALMGLNDHYIQEHLLKLIWYIYEQNPLVVMVHDLDNYEQHG